MFFTACFCFRRLGRIFTFVSNSPYFKQVKLLSSVTKASLRTHTCGELRASDVGKSVALCGWLYTTRLGAAFVLIRDAYGITQVVLEPSVVLFLVSCSNIASSRFASR